MDQRVRVFWEQVFVDYDFNWESIWCAHINCIKEPKINTLQWKILSKIYATRILLHKMKIVDDELCTRCRVKDTYEHFFFDCQDVKPLWKRVESDASIRYGVSITLTVTDILFGYNNKSKMYLELNKEILIGKLCVGKLRYGKSYNLICMYEQELRLRK